MQSGLVFELSDAGDFCGGLDVVSEWNPAKKEEIRLTKRKVML